MRGGGLARKKASHFCARLCVPSVIAKRLLFVGEEFLVFVGHLGFETHDDAAVHLADAGFGEVEGGADFLHGHFFVVVEDEDQAFGAGQALGDEALEVAALDFIGGIGGAAVFEHVNFADVLVAIGFKPFAGEGDLGDGGGILHELVVFGGGQAEAFGDFIFGGGAAEFHLQLFGDHIELVGARADQSRNPVHGAQFVEDSAADARGAVGFELDAALEVEGFDGVLQAKNPGLHEVVEFDFVGQFGVDALGVVLDHGKVFHHEQVAQLLRLGLFEGAPDVVDVLYNSRSGGVCFRHGSLLDLF